MSVLRGAWWRASNRSATSSLFLCRAGAMMCDVRALALGHFRGDVAVLDREGAAEAAAGLAFLHLDELESFHLGEELARLRFHAQLAQPRARIVVGHRALEGRRNLRAMRHLRQEIRQLVGARTQAFRPSEHPGIAFENLREMHADHAGARARGHDDVRTILELGDELPCEPAGRLAVARIPAGLAAAGLRRGNDDIAAGVLEQLERGKADRRPHQIDETSHEQADAHEKIITRATAEAVPHRGIEFRHSILCSIPRRSWPSPNPGIPSRSSGA